MTQLQARKQHEDYKFYDHFSLSLQKKTIFWIILLRLYMEKPMKWSSKTDYSKHRTFGYDQTIQHVHFTWI